MNGLITFLKGFLMGLCDIIPGVSGGTIAFITGIYEKFIFSVDNIWIFIKNLLLFFFKKINLEKLRISWKNIHVGFLLTLLFGIFTAVFLASSIISFLLTNYFVFTLSFFIGLILASSLLILKKTKIVDFKSIINILIGILVGISFAFLIPQNTVPSLFYIFIGGFIAISAMFLPGISGAFILLILGLYGFILDAVNTLNVKILLIFLTGIIFGAIVISRIISKLFRTHKNKTLLFLTGLIIGSLSVPLKSIYFNTVSEFFFSLGFVCIGLIIAFAISFLERKAL